MGGFNVSVAMCTFNGARFLGAQLRSIAAQQRPPDEVIICDDGSSDGSIDVIREFARQSPIPTRLVVNSDNLGSTKNFEKAIRCVVARLLRSRIRTTSGIDTSSNGSKRHSCDRARLSPRSAMPT